MTSPDSFSPERVTVAFEDGPVTLLLRRAPVGNSSPIRGQTLAIFPPLSETDEADAEPGPGAPAFGHQCYPATTEPGGQPATAVLGLGEAEAAAMGAGLGLRQVFFWDGRRASLLDCAPAN